jgi:hypothetical protein
MKKTFLGFSAVALMALMISGCAKLPQVEMDAAKAAVETAKSVEANRYVPAEFNALQDSLNAAVAGVEAEKSKFFLTRSYTDLTQKLTAVTAASEEVKTKAEERKAQVRTEVQEALTVLTDLIKEDKELLKKAPKGKEGKAALEAIQNDITVIEASVNEINTLVTNGDYLTAQDKVNASISKANAIKDELKAAIAKVKRK